MTDKELQDFIKHGETGFVEFAMVFGDGWARHAIEIAKELRARLSQCERCGEVNPAEIHTCTPQVCCQEYETCTRPCTPRGREQTKREWQGLTDEEVWEIPSYDQTSRMYRFARAIEAKLKEKNS